MFTDPSEHVVIMAAGLAGANHSLRDINLDHEYHEEVTSSEESSQARVLTATQPLVSERIKEAVFL